MVKDEVVYDLKDGRWLKNINQVRNGQGKVVLIIDDGPSRLLHELEQTVSVLPEIIDQVRDKGFEFVLL